MLEIEAILRNYVEARTTIEPFFFLFVPHPIAFVRLFMAKNLLHIMFFRIPRF